jgi:hypothetical protein
MSSAVILLMEAWAWTISTANSSNFFSIRTIPSKEGTDVVRRQGKKLFPNMLIEVAFVKRTKPQFVQASSLHQDIPAT